MASAIEERICLCLFLFLFLHLSTSTTEIPIPAPWPEQFHSVLFVNRSGTLRKTDLWYDWPNRRNFNIIQYQLSVVKYDVEWNNGTSFIYIPFNSTCEKLHFDVGILPPNWLQGANYLGQEYADNFLCNVWEKVDFIWYYEDVLTRRPIKWIFYDGMVFHVMTFEVGAVLEDEHWQAPGYCFSKSEPEPRIHNIMNSSLLDLKAGGGGGDAASFRRTLMSEMR
ncbi:unnamed protein product [Lathyrus sativus]|nr:unnamed protein product [Lathyrus sativus]